MAVVFIFTVARLPLGVKLRVIPVTLILFAVIPLIKLPLILILITIYPTIVLVIPVLREAGSFTTMKLMVSIISQEHAIWKRRLHLVNGQGKNGVAMIL